MDDITLRMMQLGASGLCCSQVMLALALENQGRENTALVRAMSGLCDGMGDCSQACGVLTGGLCLLGLYAGRGAADEEEHERYPLMRSTLLDWFRETVGSEYGGIACGQILGEGGCGQPDAARCGSILARSFQRCLEILVENGIDPMEAREEGD